MNENHDREYNSGIAETINLGEDSSVAGKDSIIKVLKSFFKTIRTNFSQKSEKSMLSYLLESVYLKLLSGKIRVFGVFLLSFSLTSLIISYLIGESLSVFISDINTFTGIVLLIISLILFTSNKSLHQLIIGSKILSSLSIVYNEQLLVTEDETVRGNASSTPFFLGVICGIFSVIYPVSAISMFVLSLLLVLFIFNRPEFGMLLILAVLPLLSKPLLLTLMCITFLALIYRYLLGKRHIDFNVSTALIIIAILYIVFRCIVTDGYTFSNRFFIYISFFISCIAVMNLVRSTAMFRRTFTVLIKMTRAFTVILILYYLSNMFFGTSAVGNFLYNLNISNLVYSITSTSFAAPFLAMAVPMNFSYFIGINKGKEALLNAIWLLLLFASLIYVSSYELILICIISCVAILVFFKIKYIFLILPAPFAAYALQKIFNSIPSEYSISASNDAINTFSEALDLMKLNPLFGSGPYVTGFNGNMLFNVLITFGIIGVVLLAAVVISMTASTIKSISADFMKSNKARFLSIGLLCSQLSFLAVCLFTDIYCDLNVIFMFSAIMSASYTSGKCYKADYIDTGVVREYKNK